MYVEIVSGVLQNFRVHQQFLSFLLHLVILVSEALVLLALVVLNDSDCLRVGLNRILSGHLVQNQRFLLHGLDNSQNFCVFARKFPPFLPLPLRAISIQIDLEVSV